ncbi:MAG: hypothetical protein AAFQ57_00715 [Cyanobacteria bacterium J06626_14]
MADSQESTSTISKLGIALVIAMTGSDAQEGEPTLSRLGMALVIVMMGIQSMLYHIEGNPAGFYLFGILVCLQLATNYCGWRIRKQESQDL